MSSDSGLVRYLVVGRVPLDPAIPALSPVQLGSGIRDFAPGWLHEHRNDPLPGVQADRDGSLPWEKAATLISTLGLRNATVTADCIREVRTGLAYAGITCGAGQEHWGIEGDATGALQSGGRITLVSGASLSTKIDMFAHTRTRSYPLAELASESVLAELIERGERIISVTFAEQGLSLDERETVQRLASTIAKLVLGMPGEVRRKTRIRLDIPCEQRWLAVLVAAQRGLIPPEVCLTWFERVKAHSLLLEDHFSTILEGMLGPYFHQIRSDNELHLGGRYLLGALKRNAVPKLADILRVLGRKRIWQWVLQPEIQRTIDPRFGGPISTVSHLIDMAGMITLMATAADGAVIAVDAPEPTARAMGFTEAFAREILAQALGMPPRVVAVYPLSKFIGDLRAAPGSYVPDSGADSGLSRVVRLNNGDQRSFDHLLTELYAV